MNEYFLHYVFKHRLYDPVNLKTAEEEQVEILHQGMLNPHEGPDFSEAKIRIGGRLWAGQVEIHVKASDWNAHRHFEDPRYDNVILHVVLENDGPIKTREGREIPCLELRHRIYPWVYQNYLQLMKRKSGLACSGALVKVEEEKWKWWLHRVMIERLESKFAFLETIFLEENKNLEITFYRYLCRSFGLKDNADAFFELSGKLPLSIVLKHGGNVKQIEAMLFGVAGWLEGEQEDKYMLDLQNEFAFLKHKYHLPVMASNAWKFMRMRPTNFPTVRMAELAMVLQHYEGSCAKWVMDFPRRAEEIPAFLDGLKKGMDGGTSSYWESHYRPGKAAEQKTKRIGDGAFNSILINTLAPFLFFYGRQFGHAVYEEMALELLLLLPEEKNQITRIFAQEGKSFKNALESQALVQLYKQYCIQRQCLDCVVGNAIVNEPQLAYERIRNG